MRARSFAVTVLVLFAGVGSACGSSGGSSSSDSTESAQKTVCSNADDLKTSVNKLVDDVKSGNFGDAQDQVSTVKSDFQALEKSAQDLASSKKSAVKDDLDQVKGTLTDLSSANSTEEIQSTLNTAKKELDSTVDAVKKTVNC